MAQSSLFNRLRIDRRAGATADDERRPAEEELIHLVCRAVVGQILEIKNLFWISKRDFHVLKEHHISFYFQSYHPSYKNVECALARVVMHIPFTIFLVVTFELRFSPVRSSSKSLASSV